MTHAHLESDSSGRRPNGFLRLSLNDRTILFIAILMDKTVSVEHDSLCIRTLASHPPRRVAVHQQHFLPLFSELGAKRRDLSSSSCRQILNNTIAAGFKTR